MSDNRRRYNAIKSGLEQLYGSKIEGHFKNHLHTLALLINGIIGAGNVQLPVVATKAPLESKLQSRAAKLTRFVKNDKISEELYWLPFVKQLLAQLSQQAQGLTLIMDGSVIGRSCVALVVGVVYAGRALPIGWLVVKGKKGHFGQDKHLELITKIQPLIPNGTPVTFLGDGEFDGTLLQEEVNWHQWHYVVRTAKNSQLYLRSEGRWTSYEQLGLQKGEVRSWQGVGFSGEGYGNLLAISWWEASYEEPIYLISNLSELEQALAAYKLRFRIETLFSDCKRRGFGLQGSRLSKPERLARLMIGVALAYWWLTYLGVKAQKQGWDRLISRTERCDLSYFQLAACRRKPKEGGLCR
jgi:hypothetical protein